MKGVFDNNITLSEMVGNRFCLKPETVKAWMNRKGYTSKDFKKIETGLLTLRVFENARWKSDRKTDAVNIAAKEHASIDYKHFSGDYAGDIRITGAKTKTF